MPNSSCQGSINISFVFIVHYARTVTCVGLFFLLVFFSFLNFIYLFLGGVSVCLVKGMLCSYSTCLIGLCSTEKMKAGLHAAFFCFVSYLHVQDITFVCNIDLVIVFSFSLLLHNC